MRVCHLVDHLALGGLEQQLLRIVEATDDESVSYTVCYFGEDESLRSDFESAGARVVRLTTGDARVMGRFLPWNVWRVVEFFRRESFDVLHCHTSLYLHVLGRVYGQLSGTPVVGTYHNTRENFNPAIQVLERVTRPLSAINIAVSKDVERSYANSAREYRPGTWTFDRRTCTVYNGIDVDGFRSRVDTVNDEAVRSEWGVADALVYLTVGRYAKEKNQHSLIRAMVHVVDERPDAHLVLVGWGALEADLRRAAERFGIADSVTVTGRVPSVVEFYALADVFVLPSLTEGLSVVLLEAMAAGLPIVATDVPGTGEAVVDDETGLLVPPDSPRALARAMIELGAEPLRRRLGKGGFDRVRTSFSIERTVAAYLDIYESVT